MFERVGSYFDMCFLQVRSKPRYKSVLLKAGGVNVGGESSSLGFRGVSQWNETGIDVLDICDLSARSKSASDSIVSCGVNISC